MPSFPLVAAPLEAAFPCLLALVDFAWVSAGGLLLVAVLLGLAWWRERRCVLQGREEVRRARAETEQLRQAAERAQAEMVAVQGRLELAEKVFDHSPDAILVMDPHDDERKLRIVACNQYTCQLHGWMREEMVGKSINVLEESSERWNKAEVDKLLISLRHAPIRRGETVHRRRDGTLFPIEYSNNLIVVGGRELLVGFDRDITARKQSERAMRASEERFRAIINASPVGMLLQDPHDPEVPLRIVDANLHAAQIHGVTVEQLIGRSINDFDKVKADFATAQRRVQRMRQVRTATGEAVHLRADGTEFPVEFLSTYVMLDGREYILGLDRDISERRQIDMELNESRRLRSVGAMVAGVAHEFNNLLTPILLYFEEHRGPETRAIRQAVEQARELTQRILAFGRRPASGVAEACEVSAALRECLDLMGKTIDRRIRIESMVAPECRARISRGDFSQIFINLLLNARDTLLDKLNSSPSPTWQPCIDLRASRVAVLPFGSETRAGDWVRVQVTDNGMGMSAAVRERVFDPFFTTKPSGRGTGLGLATVWHLVQAAGGHVRINSPVSEGVEVEVFLPVATSEPMHERPPEDALVAKNESPRAPGGKRVLLVEDNALVTRALLPMLEAGGYLVTHVADGAIAHTAITAELKRWDCILTDLNLPGMHGAALVKAIRAAGYDGLVVAYSGMIDRDSAAELRKAGVKTILQKPFAMKSLWEALAG